MRPSIWLLAAALGCAHSFVATPDRRHAVPAAVAASTATCAAKPAALTAASCAAAAAGGDRAVYQHLRLRKQRNVR